MKKVNRYGVLDPEGMLRGNIKMWQGQGHSDWHIGKVLMHPRLKTPEDFEYWGLEYNPPDGSALSPLEPKHRANRRESLARLHDALDKGIAGSQSLSRERLCRIAQIGNGTFQSLCIEYPEVHRKWSQLKRLNRTRISDKGKKFVRIGQARRRKLDDAAKVVDQAIADMRPITMEQLSLAVGQYSSWFQQLCRDGCYPALALRKQMDEHNDNLRYAQRQSA